MRTSTAAFERHVAVYRSLLLLYPRRFRHEYGSDMVQLFCDQLGHHNGDFGVRHVWSRTLRDVVKSAPFERMEVLMSGARSALWLGLGVLASTAVFMVMLGGYDFDHPGDMMIILATILAIEGVIITLAYLYRRAALRSTESTWQRSPLRHWWAVLGGVVAVFYLALGTMQFVDEPTSGNAVSLAVSAAFAGSIAGGLLLRAKRSGTIGDWLVAVGVLPGIGAFWFPPLAIACLLSLIGAIGEGLAGGARPHVRLSS